MVRWCRVWRFNAGTGHDTNFVMRLPAMEQGSAQAGALAPRVAGGGLRVLIMDDDPDAAESTAMLLELHGFKARTASARRASSTWTWC